MYSFHNKIHNHLFLSFILLILFLVNMHKKLNHHQFLMTLA
ncbi:cytochrome b [Bienertia sinuspersici]